MHEEPQIIVADREQLIALLTEAAEIEHGLMCCYLYAAFSLKTSDDCGLTPAQLSATRRWRSVIIDVAIEEMLHLGLVANLMTAIGATPHFSRPNFPVSAGYHPSGVVVELDRFCPATIDHFVYLERPEGVELPDGDSFAASRSYVRATRPDVLVPSAQDFLTVGHLYRAIGNGFTALARDCGEAALFIGSPAAQIGPDISGFDKLIRVTGLASAKSAIEAIVEQGEGSPGAIANSHYMKFCSVRDEFARMRTEDFSFDPAWPVARNPVMRKPPTPDGKVHVSAAEAARTLDVGNAIYGLMLRCLMGAFGQANATAEDQRLLYGMAIDLMHAVVPLAERLVRLPAQDSAAMPNAGLTFTLPRSITPVHAPAMARTIIAERLMEIATSVSTEPVGDGALTSLAADLARIATHLGVTLPTPPAPAAPAQAQGELPKRQTAASGLRSEAGPAAIEEAIGRDVIIRFDGKRCIHARFCVLQAPSVFKANTPGTWIYPDTMDAEQLVAVAESCPSGAITYERRNVRPAEAPPPVNVARIRENGPYAVHADIDLAGAGRMMRATLCRCGASNNKPFCDGSHTVVGFAASGEPETRPSDPLATRNGPLTITPLRNGPLTVSGPLEVCSGTGRTADRVTMTRLCRCGGSQTKPYCDGTHVRIGFKAE